MLDLLCKRGKKSHLYSYRFESHTDSITFIYTKKFLKYTKEISKNGHLIVFLNFLILKT